jgi:peptidoglycan/xylan/chitin deacetylase (PgdA/CDA1 family)
MKFVIRDDDACAFTTTEELRACYERIWSDVPVSLSVTPFRVPANDRNAPPNCKGSMEALPLDQNAELVEFIRKGLKNGQLDVTLHGYHHLRYSGMPEFISGDELPKKAREGKAYLEEILGVDIKTFVPPYNGISRSGLDAIVDAGMNLAGTLRLWSPRFRRVTLRTLANTPRVWWHRRVRGRRYPFILDLGDHQEVACHTVGPRSNFSALRRELDYCYQSDGVFVLATHYHAFERRTEDGHAIGKVVNELADRAAGFSDTRFVKFNNLWEGR